MSLPSLALRVLVSLVVLMALLPAGSAAAAGNPVVEVLTPSVEATPVGDVAAFIVLAKDSSGDPEVDPV